MRASLKALRSHAVASSLFRPTTLKRAVEQLGFVQADPIRAPARAQDLILRHRVKGYRAGDLDQRYAKLLLEEDFLYAYGFMPRSTWQLIHPRFDRKLTVSEQLILELVSTNKRLHPRDLEAHLGRKREINAWGGYSKATTRTLHKLHFEGRLRVAGRENGVRLYEPTKEQCESLGPEERLRKLVLLVANIFAPLPERSLRATLRQITRYTPALKGAQSTLAGLLNSGELRAAEVDGLRYVWPAGPLTRNQDDQAVRFLAPFDPLVWDRRRFEHFWSWPYRFEAYTPSAKRKHGYYAMPLLWHENIIGWVNVSKKGGSLSVEAGYITAKPTETQFNQEFDSEVSRLELFLQSRPPGASE